MQSTGFSARKPPPHGVQQKAWKALQAHEPVGTIYGSRRAWNTAAMSPGRRGKATTVLRRLRLALPQRRHTAHTQTARQRRRGRAAVVAVPPQGLNPPHSHLVRPSVRAMVLAVGHDVAQAVSSHLHAHRAASQTAGQLWQQAQCSTQQREGREGSLTRCRAPATNGRHPACPCPCTGPSCRAAAMPKISWRRSSHLGQRQPGPAPRSLSRAPTHLLWQGDGVLLRQAPLAVPHLLQDVRRHPHALRAHTHTHTQQHAPSRGQPVHGSTATTSAGLAVGTTRGGTPASRR